MKALKLVAPCFAYWHTRASHFLSSIQLLELFLQITKLQRQVRFAKAGTETLNYVKSNDRISRSRSFENHDSFPRARLSKQSRRKRFRRRGRRRRTRPDTRPPVADGWAGAEMRVFTLFHSCSPTDQPTNRRTDKTSYRVACPQLKSLKIFQKC